jgi:hypothetical protein
MYLNVGTPPGGQRLPSIMPNLSMVGRGQNMPVTRLFQVFVDHVV